MTKKYVYIPRGETPVEFDGPMNNHYARLEAEEKWGHGGNLYRKVEDTRPKDEEEIVGCGGFPLILRQAETISAR